VNVVFRGTRGSLPSPRPETARYGGNTSCVEVRAAAACVAVLDAGTGIRNVDGTDPALRRVDVLLTHLHMDHIIGLGFFRALYREGLEVHVWGPPSTAGNLHGRLTRYLSPPLFPVRLRDLPCRLNLHDAPRGTFDIPGLVVTADFVSHPGPTLGYRLDGSGGALAYLPDHEPVLGGVTVPDDPRWTSGFDLADGADVLVHDAQYTDEQYLTHVGWGHSALSHALTMAEHTGAKRLFGFHHDPDHDDAQLDALYAEAADGSPVAVAAAQEGASLTVEG
jgi:phosphoribosyl 1,2-cyclic phosphodiesterase